MNTMRAFYHLALADFLERIRGYGFLIALGLTLFLGYSIARGQLVLVVGQYYRGVLNAAWVGGLVATMVIIFLGLFGFYLVKGSVERDYKTDVGQILASTPITRPLYTLGKWVSNFTVLGIMTALLMAVAVVMQLFYRETPAIDWWALLSPFFFLVLPFMALTAALAVLFETIEGLRGGLGNVIYFFFFISIITTLGFAALSGANPILDISGIGILSNSMGQAARAVSPNDVDGFRITWLVPELQVFHWDGVEWTAAFLLSRLVLVLLSIGIAALSAVFFDRFTPSRLFPVRRTKTAWSSLAPAPVMETPSISNLRLTPLNNARMHFRLDVLFIAELRLLLKGQRWWWYAIAAALIIAQLVAPLTAVHNLLVVAWVWHMLLISGLGCRESRYNTSQIVFSAHHPLMIQLPAAWLSAFTVTALLGSGALMRFIVAGETFSVLGWLTGALFIPSLALALGALTGSRKAFEVLFVLWMYMLTQKIPWFDFIGMTPTSPLYLYILMTLALQFVVVFARQRCINQRIIG